MPINISAELFMKELKALLIETFEKVDGIYLDRGTSLLESIGSLSAEQASRTVRPGGTTIAGQIEHIRFYLRILNDFIDGKRHENLDWKQSWLVSKVTDSEWKEQRDQLATDYRLTAAHLNSISDWNDEKHLGGALAIVVHTAYHLGAIRQIVLSIREQ